VFVAILTTFETAMGQQPAPWPDASTLLAQYSTLVRGRFDTAAHQTRYTRQHTEIIPGITGTIEKFQRKPAELVQKTTASDGSMVLDGYDGNVAWEMRDGVARLLTGYEAQAFKDAAAFYDGLLTAPIAAQLARNAATVGEARVGDDTVFAICVPGTTLATAEAGGFPIAYISKSTGLLTSTSVGGGNKPFFVRQTFGNYRDFGGLLVATKLTTTSRRGTTNFEHSVTIDEVRWDSVSERELELPEAVRTLIKP
jgi:hypothetical protein